MLAAEAKTAAWSITTITPPAIEPVTLAEAREQCELTGMTDHDAKLRGFIQTARALFERCTNRTTNQATVEQYRHEWPSEDYFSLRRSPLIAVSAQAWKDTAGAETVMAVNTDYLVDSVADPPRIVLPYSGTWPSGTLYPQSPIRTRFTAGYGKNITVTADATADSLTATAHGLSDGQDVLMRSTATVPGGLASDTRYWIVSAAADTFKLAATPGGSAIDLTSAGTGTITVTVGIPAPIRQGMLLLIDHFFSNRSAVIIGQTATIAAELPMSVAACWAPYKAPYYC